LNFGVCVGWVIATTCDGVAPIAARNGRMLLVVVEIGRIATITTFVRK
jgi:hypothetical protein